MFAAAFADLRSHSFPLPLTSFSGRKVKMKKYDGIYLVLMLSAFFAGGGMGSVSVIFPAAVLDISFLTVLILAGRQDMRDMKIADQWQLLMLGLAATACLLEPEPLFFSRALGFFCGSPGSYWRRRYQAYGCLRPVSGMESGGCIGGCRHRFRRSLGIMHAGVREAWQKRTLSNGSVFMYGNGFWNIWRESGV